MARDEILHGGQAGLEERIRQLKSVIQKSEKHGSVAGEHINKLQDVVLGMENILSKYNTVAGA